jgi:hypothetical protein
LSATIPLTAAKIRFSPIQRIPGNVKEFMALKFVALNERARHTCCSICYRPENYQNDPSNTLRNYDLCHKFVLLKGCKIDDSCCRIDGTPSNNPTDNNYTANKIACDPHGGSSQPFYQATVQKKECPQGEDT